MTLEVYRPGPQTKQATQTVFLDFDGARVNTYIFGGPGVRELRRCRRSSAAGGSPPRTRTR